VRSVHRAEARAEIHNLTKDTPTLRTSGRRAILQNEMCNRVHQLTNAACQGSYLNGQGDRHPQSCEADGPSSAVVGDGVLATGSLAELKAAAGEVHQLAADVQRLFARAGADS
jgi:hypothetical protein